MAVFQEPGPRITASSPDFRDQIPDDAFEPVRRHLDGRSFQTALDRELYLEMRFAMVSSPLFKVDKMSMAHGLEVRVPMLDHQFIETCADDSLD